MAGFSTTGEVIDALGGTARVAALFDVDGRVVSNWRAQSRFPAKTYVVLRDALSAIGEGAPESLWSMAQPATPPAHTEEGRAETPSVVRDGVAIVPTAEPPVGAPLSPEMVKGIRNRAAGREA